MALYDLSDSNVSLPPQSEAEGIGVKAVATLDQDWHRVDSFDVYTCS